MNSFVKQVFCCTLTNVYFQRQMSIFGDKCVFFCTRVSPQRPAWFLRDEVVTGVFTVRNLQEVSGILANIFSTLTNAFLLF